MSATIFNRAIARRPAESCVRGLRARDVGAPEIEAFRRQHGRYVEALEALGLAVTVLDAAEDQPDSVFIEDPALCLDEGAVLLRSAAPSRSAEAEALRPALMEAYGGRIADLEDGFVDGGDVMVTDREIIVGLSNRTDKDGVAALGAIVRAWGRTLRAAATPAGVLHLKSDGGYLGAGMVLSTPALAASGAFDGYDVIETAPGEAAAANALCVNGVVLIAAGFPRTSERLREKGLSVTEIEMSEAAKLDGGLSCLSLRYSTDERDGDAASSST